MWVWGFRMVTMWVFQAGYNVGVGFQDGHNVGVGVSGWLQCGCFRLVTTWVFQAGYNVGVGV